jgi:hypothetical protein
MMKPTRSVLTVFSGMFLCTLSWLFLNSWVYMASFEHQSPSLITPIFFCESSSIALLIAGLITLRIGIAAIPNDQ